MMIELRSDTFTVPTPEMLQAMMQAKVGDDVFEEDETITALEEKTAALFGMEAGLFCPSGTMTNQIAIKCHTNPMEEVICDAGAHIYQYEGGGIAFNSAASVRLLSGKYGILNAVQIAEAINPDNVHYPKTTLVALENTSNKGGGSYYELKSIQEIAQVCKQHSLRLHLDGARVFNALTASGDKPSAYGACFDSISVCLSKGLGAPVGSVLVGSKATIYKARRIRKVLGGGMRQAGFLAAAGIYALDNHVSLLQADHYRAATLGKALENCSFVQQVLPVKTNIVIFELKPTYLAEKCISDLAEKGIKATIFGKQHIRFVTHFQFTDENLEQTVAVLKGLK